MNRVEILFFPCFGSRSNSQETARYRSRNDWTKRAFELLRCDNRHLEDHEFLLGGGDRVAEILD